MTYLDEYELAPLRAAAEHPEGALPGWCSPQRRAHIEALGGAYRGHITDQGRAAVEFAAELHARTHLPDGRLRPHLRDPSPAELGAAARQADARYVEAHADDDALRG